MTAKKLGSNYPKDWTEKLLGDEDLAEIISGGTPSTQVPEYWNGNIWWATPTDITATRTKYLSKTERRITLSGLKSSGARMLPPGSILLCSRATVGELRISTVPICTNQGFKSVVAKQGVSSEFLYYKLLTMKDEMISRSYGSTFLELPTREAKALQLYLPKIEEQQLIAEALTQTDELIAALDKLIAKKKDIKQGTMQQLLTGKIRLPGFSGDWVASALGSICNVEMGQSPLGQFYNSSGRGLPLIQGNADIADRQTFVRTWTSASPKTCEKGDVVMTVRAPVGYVARAHTKIALGRGVCALRNPSVDNGFLFQALIFAERKWEIISQGTTFTAANANEVKSFKLFMPVDTLEQAGIAEVLADMDAEIDALIARRDKTALIKTGMMQELLTGRTRLI